MLQNEMQVFMKDISLMIQQRVYYHYQGALPYTAREVLITQINLSMIMI